MALKTFATCIDVAASPQQVWDTVVDWERQSTWVPLTRSETVNGPADRVGGRVRAWTGLGPVGFWDTMTITAWEPPSRLELLHTGRVVRGEAGFELRDTADGAHFCWWERVVVPGGRLADLAWPLVRPVAEAGLAAVLRRLRDRVESTPR